MHRWAPLSSRSAAVLLAALIVGPAAASPPAAIAAEATLPSALGNGGFEEPAIPAGQFRPVPKGGVPFWHTTATDGVIEIWEQGYSDDIDAHGGRQFAEINANQRAALFQDIATTPGTRYRWSIAHRGRASATVPDVMELRIGAQTTPTDQAKTSDVQALPRVAGMSDTNARWGEYSGEYVVPDGQTVTRFGFLAVSEASGNPTVGNFIDSIVFSIPQDVVPPPTVTTVAPAPVTQAGSTPAPAAPDRPAAAAPSQAAPQVQATLPRTGGSPMRTGRAGLITLGAGLLALVAGRGKSS